jgi:hypothetical protein
MKTSFGNRSRRTRFVVVASAAAGLCLAASLGPVGPAQAAESCNPGVTVRVTGSSTFTTNYYETKSTGAVTEALRSAPTASLGYLDFKVITCKNPTTGWYARDVDLLFTGVRLTNVQTQLVGSTVTYRPVGSASKGYGFMPGPQTSGPGKRTLSFMGLECRSVAYSQPWTITKLVLDFVPLKLGTVLEPIVKTVGSWAIDSFAATAASGFDCGKPLDADVNYPILKSITLTINTAGAVSVGAAQTLQYSKWSSQPTQCPAKLYPGSSVIDCGLHYLTYLKLTPSRV